MKFTINNRVIKGDQDLFIIGDNADYTAEFLFDSEWNGKTKTARFIAPNGKYKDVLINEDKCIIPVEILKAGYSKVGVYSAEMTTTEHKFFVNKSIKNETGFEAEPTPSVYEQLTKLLDDLYKLMPDEIAQYFEDHKEEFKGDKGDKGEKGEDGAIKFIPVNELPTENIEEVAIYLKPSNDPANQNAYDEYIYTNGNWESIGTANVKFDADGYVKVEELENYLKKNTTTAGNRLYASQSTSDGSIVQTTVGYSTSAVANMVAVRESGGALNVGTPTKDTHATTKIYVDERAEEAKGITTLVGTTENPINFATDMQIGKAYVISGVVRRASNKTITFSHYVLAIKRYDNQVLIYNYKITDSGAGTDCRYISYLYIYENTGYIDRIEHYFVLPKGDEGQIVQFISGKPAWADMPALPTFTATQLEDGSYSLTIAEA